MRFRNRKWRLYSDRQMPLEADAIVGDQGLIAWDGAYDELLEPLDDEAKAAVAALRRGPDGRAMRTPVDPARPDAYGRTGQDTLKTGIDPRYVGPTPQFTGHNPKDRG